MDKDNSYEIPFGAFDSELKGWEYTIPEGMEAEIKDGKIIVREKETEDERIREQILDYFMAKKVNESQPVLDSWIAWLEKQSKKEEINEASYRTGIKRVLDNPESYGLEKQGEQNLANSEKTCKDEQNPAWSEEDSEMRMKVLKYLSTRCNVFEYEEVECWFKCLEERYTWKPSDEQMKQ